MSELSDYLIGQIAQTTRSTESAVLAMADTLEEHAERLDRVRAALEDLTTWAQRLALLGMLWGAAVGINVNPEKLGELLATFLKSAK